MCPDLIEAHGSKHGLTNSADYTRFFSNFLLILYAFPAVLFTATPTASVLNQRDVSFLARSCLEAAVFKLALPRSDALSTCTFSPAVDKVSNISLQTGRQPTFGSIQPLS